MNLELKKIYCHGDSNAMVYISIEVTYGWKDKMCKDLIRVNYNGIKRDSFITIKLLNPGIGHVIERLVEFITSIDFTSKEIKNPPLTVLERLSEKFGLHYDPEVVKEALEPFMSSMDNDFNSDI